MKSFGLSAYAVSAGVAVILLAACGGSPPIGAPAAMPQGRAIAVHAAGFTYETLYRFKNKDDGGYPNAGVIAGLNVVYGTTNVGGPSKSGTVFVAAPSGKEAVLYSFKGGLDGAYPDATVTATHGELYGTTTEGATIHGFAVGNNLIKAHLDCGEPDGAQRIVRSLNALKRPDYRAYLDYWDTEITKARNNRESETKPNSHEMRQT